ncbi:DUF2318 domain-containing protein [Sinanaerobacter chloroacetimidivorans]|jgi:uncharacterized membrane protein|nr:DUF2318 domain-containing protein [Sinanaerobacter chloroacetimidivorans]
MKKSNIMIVIALVIVSITAFSMYVTKGNDGDAGQGSAAIPAVNENGDLEIPIADITEDATFYAYDELDSKMEVIAVKASDGTIRTAFNTCQVCYGSGRGYYIQEGDSLVCQNCGNRFGMDDVALTRGGCNPVPIPDDKKEANGESIIISKEFLKEAEVIFQNWKL